MEDLAKQIKGYAGTVSKVLEEVSTSLLAEEYGRAIRLMAELTTAHADATLKMRNILIRKGLVGGDEDV